MPAYVMGDVADRPGKEELDNSPAGKKLQEFRAYVDTHCADCTHIRYCRGGCPYNAMVPASGEIAGVDPHCTAYKRIFTEISDRISDEMYGSGEDQGICFPPGPKPGLGTPGIMALMQKMLDR
jgi:uncharacterized protein